jgi:malate dehydrogenase (oxaloacetate-decarboxylating)(NADP+)
VRRFGLTPKVALLSHSNFGSLRTPSALKMSRTRELITARAPELEVDGEMHGDAALAEEIRQRLYPDCKLRGEANLLVMPNLDAANIAFNLIKASNGDGITVGPILLGAARPVHILTPTATVRRLNMTALRGDANHLRSCRPGSAAGRGMPWRSMRATLTRQFFTPRRSSSMRSSQPVLLSRSVKPSKTKLPRL